jgi:phosphoribosylamine--glycine ligase
LTAAALLGGGGVGLGGGPPPPDDDILATALVDDDTALLLGTSEARTVQGEAQVRSPALAGAAARIVQEILTPLVRALAREQATYGGFLALRLRIAADGAPQLVGLRPALDDLHAPAWAMRLQSDLHALLDAAAERYLDATTLRSNPRTAVGLVRTATPADAGRRITSTAPVTIGSQVFHQATRHAGDHAIVAGTHVLTVCALGDDANDAARRAADTAATVDWSSAPTAIA